MREWLVMVGWVGGLAAGAVRRRCCYPGRVGSAGGGGGGVLRGKGRRRNETEAVEVGFFALLRRRGVAKTGGRSSKEADPGFGLVCVQLGMRAISEPPEIRGGLGRLPTDVSGGWWLWLVVQWMVCVDRKSVV